MSADEHSKTFGESPMVDVYVGPEKKLYRYHKAVLCEGAPYFATSLKDSWNGKTLQIEFKDVDLYTFTTVMSWIYKFSKPADLPSNSKTFAVDVARLYKFADYLMMEEAKNGLVDRLITYLSGIHHISFAELESIHELEISGTKMFQLALRNCVRHFIKFPAGYTIFGHCCEGVQNTALLTIVLEGVRDYHLKPWSEVEASDRCKYHDHVSTPVCGKPTVNRSKTFAAGLFEERSARYSSKPTPTPPSAHFTGSLFGSGGFGGPNVASPLFTSTSKSNPSTGPSFGFGQFTTASPTPKPTRPFFGFGSANGST